MGLLAASAAAFACWAAVARGDPVLNVDDERFSTFHRLEKGDSRCGCPALNALANHGFLPPSGRGINVTDIIRAAYQGLGVSPETSALVTIDGLIESGNSVDLVFELADLQRKSWRIAHDASFARPDASQGRGFAFDQAAWDLAADAMATCGRIGPQCLGRAKAARVQVQRAANPRLLYDKSAAAHGATEMGMLLGVFPEAEDTDARLLFIRQLFENEALPRRLGWRPSPFVADIDSVLDLGAVALAVEPETLQMASDGQVVTPADIATAIRPPNPISQKDLIEIIRGAGFTNPKLFERLSSRRRA